MYIYSYISICRSVHIGYMYEYLYIVDTYMNTVDRYTFTGTHLSVLSCLVIAI